MAKTGPGPLRPDMVVYFNGQFIRCYPLGSRRSSLVVAIEQYTAPVVFIDGPIRARENAYCSLSVNGETVIPKGTATQMLGKKYPGVKHIFISETKPLEFNDTELYFIAD